MEDKISIVMDVQEWKALLNKYPNAEHYIDKETERLLKYYNEKPFKEKTKTIFLEEIKDFITLFNSCAINQEKVESEVNKIITSYFTKEDLAYQLWVAQPYFYDKSKIWWLWNKLEYHWELKDETDILNIVADISNANTIQSKEKAEIIEAMKQYGRKNIPQDIKETWIQFKDRIYDVTTGENFEALPKYFVTNPIPYKISGDPRTPTLDKIFKEWVGEDYVQTLYEIIAYSLLPGYPINRLFCFIGSGLNGKTCFLNLLRTFVGNKNICATELDTLISSRFEVTRLHKKLICLMGETDFNEMSKTSILKKLTGGDTIGFEYKNKNPFEEINYAKILIATNSLPTTTDKTLGFYRRWMIIDFPNQFSEKTDILLTIPKEEYENLATNCVITLKELLEKRQFHNEGTIEERMKKYEDHSDPVEKFLKEFITEDFDKFITKSEFERRLNEWLKENRHRAMSSVVISRRMKERGFDDGKSYIDWYAGDQLSKKQARVWFGIKWKGEKTEIRDR